MQDNLLASHKDQYIVKRLIYVNSGSNYYTELPVDLAAGLYSRNNKGKTSSLAAIKLCLLPEVNLKKNSSKFLFKAGGETFSDLQSYQYYLPSDESFIICEASNPMGVFCMILYRTNREAFAYERIVVPRSYDELRSLFWDVHSDKNEGLGAHQTGLNNLEIRKLLTKAPFGGTVLSDAAEIREAIYSRNSQEKPLSRYCLVPMSSSDLVKCSEVMRALLGMAFDLGRASTDSLPLAISAIINQGDYSTGKELGVIVDIDSALEEFNALTAAETRLNNIRAKIDSWTELQHAKEKYTNRRHQATRNFESLIFQIEPKINELDKALASIRKRIQTCKEARNTASKLSKTASDTFKRLKTTLDTYQEEVAEAKAQLKGAADARALLTPVWRAEQDEGNHDEPSTHDLLMLLAEEAAGYQEDLGNIDSIERARATLSERQMQLVTNDKLITRFQKELDGWKLGELAVDDLSSHAATVINSLNDSMVRLTDPLTKEAIKSTEGFARHFEVNDQGIHFDGQRLTNVTTKAYDREEQHRKLQLQLDDSKSKHASIKEEIAELQVLITLKPDELARKRTEVLHQIEQIKDQQAGLKNAPGIQSNLETLLKKIEALKPELDTAEKESERLDGELSKAKTQFNNLSAEDGRLQPALQDWHSLRNGLLAIAAESQQVLVYQTTVDRMPNDQPLTHIAVSDLNEQAYMLSTILEEMLLHRTKTTDLIQEMVVADIIDTTDQERFPLVHSKDSVDDIYKRLAAVFDNLESMEKTHQKNLASHNMIASNVAATIEKTQGLISNFINRINGKLESCAISNLSKVSMHLKLHEQFSSLVTEFKNHNLQQQHLMDRSFYDDLESFQKHFFVRKTHQVNIAAIIRGVSYHFVRNGEKEVVPQSNGTNSMVNAVVLSMLLNELIPDDLEMQLPVVFDEVGSLDNENLGEIHKVVSSNNLILFVANPTKNGVISRIIPVAHDLSMFVVHDEAVYGKAESIYFEGMEERLEYHGKSIEVLPDVLEAVNESSDEMGLSELAPIKLGD